MGPGGGKNNSALKVKTVGAVGWGLKCERKATGREKEVKIRVK
jgi:hypothetical protein